MNKLLFAILTTLIGGGGTLFLFSNKENDNWEKQIELDKEYYKQTPPLKAVEPYPLKTMAQWTSPVMYANNLPALARHDIVVADLENMFNNRGALLELKRMNPNLKLLAYSNPMEIWTIKYPTRPWQNKIIDEIVNNRPEWLLRTVVRDNKKGWYQNYATFWPGMVMINMSITCPKVSGEIYVEWMAKKISQEILSDPIWDGYFQDNGTINIAWLYRDEKEKLDINGDGVPDKDDLVDASWKRGVEKYLKIIRKAQKPKKHFWSFLRRKKTPERDFKIISNKGDTNLLQLVDGKFFELFPNNYLGDNWAGGWLQCMENAQKTGPMTVFQVDRATINFGLASALLLDNVYFGIGQDDAGIFPELYLETGRPLGKFYRVKNNTWLRKYERVIIRVEPLKRSGEILAYENYARLYAKQDAK